MNSLTFGASHWLWALLVLPVVAFLFVRAERRAAARLGQFVAPRLLPQLGATVNRTRRAVRFGFVLLGIALAIAALAQPRWGYTYEELKRKGLDLIVAVDTSRSMLANDVPPNRLERVKLAVQDLLTELRGDRIGLIAFAGRAFLQAPLTIDYEAAAEALRDLDTETIPEGGSNISEAIDLATLTFGKSAMGNRALIIFTDGEELSGDSVKVAKAAAEAGVRVFTVGVGTPEGSLIPLPGQSGGGTAFVKDRDGQVVKSKLDEKRLREIAEATGGMFLPLGNGPATVRQLYAEGLAKLQASEIDARISRQPIERYQWPLGAAILLLATSVLISERGRVRRVSPRPGGVDKAKNGGHRPPLQTAALSLLLLFVASSAQAAAPGLDAYRDEQFAKAYEEFQQTLQAHPNTRAKDKIEFDAGAAAYKMKDYSKALQSFSQALLSPDLQFQSRSHYNLGNTLYQRGEAQKGKEPKLQDWTNALQHYEETLKIEPANKEAQENRDFVQNKIDELKKEPPPPSPTPSPSPSPSPSPQKKDKDQKQDKDQQKDQSGSGDDKKPDQNQQPDKDSKGNGDQPQPGQTPSPSPDPQSSQGSSPTPSPGTGASASPSPQPGDASPTPGEKGDGPSPSPSPGEGENGDGTGDSQSPTPAPSGTPAKEKSGEVKGASEDQSDKQAEGGAPAEALNEGEMTEQQAETLLRSMKDEEQRVQLDERRRVRRVYNDW
ncbi:MAG: VWA domain-containing protein [Chthoniobacterales bacterium]